jgi:hypothetical protein
MPFDPYVEKALLNWCTGAAAVTRPVAWFIAMESGVPNYTSDSLAPMSRGTLSFQSASTGVSASVSLKAGAACSASAAATITWWAIFNLSSGGTRLMYGANGGSTGIHVGSGASISPASFFLTLA